MDLSVGQPTTLTGLNKGPTLEQLDHIFWRILTSWTFNQLYIPFSSHKIQVSIFVIIF